MNKLTFVIITGLAFSLMTPMLAFAKHDSDKHDKYNDLPPGLQKKVAQGKPLPPGWQKKLHRGDILEYDIYERGHVVVPLDKDGRISIEVEGSIIKLDEKSRQILDIVNIITD